MRMETAGNRVETGEQAFDLSAEEVRVLGVLVEKQMSTPDYYPMTVNALVQGCNQKTNRHPVVSFTEEDVRRALEGLQRARLAGIVAGASSRVDKYRHSLKEALGLDEAERAVLAVLMLRGSQTVGEIRARTSRMHAFDSLEAVEAVLERLKGRTPPLVVELDPQPGQKEARYRHALSSLAEPAPVMFSEADRVGQLEAEVEQLRAELDALREAFDTFRAEFE